MGKILFWAVIVLAVLTAARILAHKARAANAPTAPRKPLQASPDQSESIVRCAHCGIHLPRSDAYLMQGETWCSKDHARLGVRL